MKTCHIFCAAEFDGLLAQIRPGEEILAADGGLEHCLRLGIEPTGILGDFDSLGYIPRSSQVFPVEKDDTDSMLAAKLALERGCRRIIFYGALDGPRLDHTVANFQTLKYLADRGAEAYLVGKTYLVTVLSRETARFSADCTGILSLFCMGPDASGVTIKGLKYTLDNGSLSSGFPLGVSNQFEGAGGEITVRDGTVLMLWDRKNGLPERRRADTAGKAESC